MQDPRALYTIEADADLGDLGDPTMVVALGGYLDAGHTQRLLVEHLLRTLEHTVVAGFDVDQLIDYRARRPVMTFDLDRYTEYSDPSLALYRVVDDSGTPFLLLWGPEPDYQWERAAAAIAQLVSDLRVALVVSVHGVPMAVPHTRPVTSTVHGTTEEVRAGAEGLFRNVTLPGSLAGLLEYRLGEQGHTAAGFAVHVPHYLAQGDYPAGAAHGLERLADIAGLDLPPAALELAAADSAHLIQAELAESTEAADVVQRLEEQYDARVAGGGAVPKDAEDEADGAAPLTGESIPTADQLGAEFEAFLEELRKPPRGGI